MSVSDIGINIGTEPKPSVHGWWALIPWFVRCWKQIAFNLRFHTIIFWNALQGAFFFISFSSSEVLTMKQTQVPPADYADPNNQLVNYANQLSALYSILLIESLYDKTNQAKSTVID